MKKNAIIAIVSWSILLLIFFVWTIFEKKRKTLALAQKETYTAFNKDLAFRMWATKHGGVYVPTTPQTPPNPYLTKFPERDIQTPSGKKLTLLNPAYMMRQIMSDYESLYNIQGHITSAKFVNPINQPDTWEKKAIGQFAAGKKQISEIVSVEGQPFLRFMQPMAAKPGCLKCHADQGYQVGDIIGGIGVAVPLTPYLAEEKRTIMKMLASYLFFWLAGTITIIFHTQKLKTREDERERAVEALITSESGYREVVEGTDDLITKVDKDGRLTFVNHMGEKIFGYSKEELIGMSAFDFIHPEDQENSRHWFEDIISKGALQSSIENRQVNKKSGQIHHLLWNSNFHYDDAGQLSFISGIAHDVTERKKNEEMLLQMQKIEATGLLAGGIAHDFNNLLAVICGYVDIAQNEASADPEMVERLTNIEDAAVRACALTKKFLTFANSGMPVKKRCVLAETIENTAELSLSGTNVTRRLAIPIDLWAVNCDRQQISQALASIIINAKEAMPTGGTVHIQAKNIGREEVKLKTGMKCKTDRYIMISVLDHGCGIKERDLPKVFDPYFSTKERGSQKGMGLGLSIAASIIQKHDGHITVESKLDEQTTVSIFLPAIDEQVAQDRPLQVPGPSPSNDQEAVSHKILVMDDEDLVRDMLKKVLNNMGHAVETAQDGTEAIRLFRKAFNTEHPFQLVMLDLTVKGGMGGKEALKAIKEIDPNIKAIACSGYSDDPVILNCQYFGFDHALTKPSSKKELADVLFKVGVAA